MHQCGRRAARRPVIGEAQLDRPEPATDVGVHLVAVPEVIDEAGRERIGRAHRSPFGQLPDHRFVELSAGRDRRDADVPCRLDYAVDGFAVLGCELRAHHPVGCALVLVPLVQLGLDPELVEGAAQERRLRRHTHQAQLTRRLQPDLGGPAREHVVGGAVAALAEGLGPRHDRLAALGECAEAIAQLLHRRPRQCCATDLHDDSAHGGVVARFVQGPQDCAQAGPVPTAQATEQVVGFDLDRGGGEIDLQEQGRTAQRNHPATVARAGDTLAGS